jgi:hypothetical protein
MTPNLIPALVGVALVYGAGVVTISAFSTTFIAGAAVGGLIVHLL